MNFSRSCSMDAYGLSMGARDGVVKKNKVVNKIVFVRIVNFHIVVKSFWSDSPKVDYRPYFDDQINFSNSILAKELCRNMKICTFAF